MGRRRSLSRSNGGMSRRRRRRRTCPGRRLLGGRAALGGNEVDVEVAAVAVGLRLERLPCGERRGSTFRTLWRRCWRSGFSVTAGPIDTAPSPAIPRRRASAACRNRPRSPFGSPNADGHAGRRLERSRRCLSSVGGVAALLPAQARDIREPPRGGEPPCGKPRRAASSASSDSTEALRFAPAQRAGPTSATSSSSSRPRRGRSRLTATTLRRRLHRYGSLMSARSRYRSDPPKRASTVHLPQRLQEVRCGADTSAAVSSRRRPGPLRASR
jgi:hypothetical protein